MDKERIDNVLTTVRANLGVSSHKLGQMQEQRSLKPAEIKEIAQQMQDDARLLLVTLKRLEKK